MPGYVAKWIYQEEAQEKQNMQLVTMPRDK